MVESADAIRQAYETGRGSFRVRARWEGETLKGGGCQIVVSEIPYLVGKSKLIEKIADLISEKKLPLLDDVRDESADDVRLVLVPKNRNVDPEVLMESLFRHTDLETRIPLNMNALVDGKIPRVMSLKEVLQAFLTHRKEVLVRRANHRLDQIAHRLEMLDGYLIAYLNLDEVIRIIREEEDPQSMLRTKFKLTEGQVEAILNMRLRSLRKLQEIEIRTEHETLSLEQDKLKKLLASDALQWKSIRSEIKSLEKKYGPETPLGKRRTTLADPPKPILIPTEAIIEREDVTVICSEKGWIRCLKGHQVSPDDLKYKEGDGGKHVMACESTDKLLLFATNGKFFTLGIDKLPRGRGHGEPLRMMIDLDTSEDILSMMVIKPDSQKQFLLASNDSRGFIVKGLDVLAQTRGGKQVMTLAEGARAIACLELTGDRVVTIGDNRKVLVFPVSEVPTMARGRGVTLQKYRQGGLSDICIIQEADGIQWHKNGKRCVEKDVWTYQGRRATLGRLAPIGFPRTNKFEL
jgi:topoisomerase-4 subunit A